MTQPGTTISVVAGKVFIFKSEGVGFFPVF